MSDMDSNEMALRFRLERAQRALYYAANHLRDHPGHLEALASYRDANARVEAIVAQMRDADRAQEPADAHL